MTGHYWLMRKPDDDFAVAVVVLGSWCGLFLEEFDNTRPEAQWKEPPGETQPTGHRYPSTEDALREAATITDALWFAGFRVTNHEPLRWETLVTGATHNYLSLWNTWTARNNPLERVS